MKTSHKIAALGSLTAVAGAAACWKWMIRMPLKEFTRYALYMAALDDEICRNELEGNQIGGEVITFPPKAETLQERYQLFLQMNRAKSRRQLQKEVAEMERRLQESRQYTDKPEEQLEVELAGESEMGSRPSAQPVQASSAVFLKFCLASHCFSSSVSGMSIRSILKITGRVPSLQQAIIIRSSLVQLCMMAPPCRAV